MERLRFTNMGNNPVSFCIADSRSAELVFDKSTQSRPYSTIQALQATRILGHAIEYLTNQFVDEYASYAQIPERMQAIQILMALNRKVYSECPSAPSFFQWLRSFRLHR